MVLVHSIDLPWDFPAHYPSCCTKKYYFTLGTKPATQLPTIILQSRTESCLKDCSFQLTAEADRGIQPKPVIREHLLASRNRMNGSRNLLSRSSAKISGRETLHQCVAVPKKINILLLFLSSSQHCITVCSAEMKPSIISECKKKELPQEPGR